MSSFLSNDNFVSHYYFALMAAYICHLLCCYFPKIGRLTSDTELIRDDIITVVFSPDTTRAEAIIHSTLVFMHTFKRPTPD